MSEILEEFAFFGGPGATKYDWDTWLDGRIHKLTRGLDFTVSPTSFRGAVSNAAARRGGKARTQILGESVVIQFWTPES